VNVGGQISGVYAIAEAVEGNDISNGRVLSTAERVTRGAQGVGTYVGWATIGVAVSRVPLPPSTTLSGAALNVARRVLPRSVQTALGSVGRVLNTNVNVAFRNLWNRVFGRSGRATPTGRAGVQPYEVDTYGNLRARSLTGDGLALDHQPSNASNIARAEAALGRRLTPAEQAAIRDQGPAVAVPEELHRAASPTYGGRNTPAQIAADAANPLVAVIRDTQAMIDAASAANRAAAEAAAAILRALAGG
jgi:hypothetical protein